MCKRLMALFLVLGLSMLGSGWAGEKLLQQPPESLAQWYKPMNERQVWLHNMFKLRREMQAVTEYAARGEQALTQKWSGRLVEHYRKIGEMVPEWQDELELEWAARLLRSAEEGNYPEVNRAVKKLGMSCRSCHREFRALTAARYRTPDYSKVLVEDSETLEEQPLGDVMDRLSLLVNRIKIASEDEQTGVALESLNELGRRFGDLSKSCSGCHKDETPKERILGRDTLHLLEELRAAVQQGDRKTAGRKLGGMAVTACARCHGVHRTLYDLNRFIAE